MKVEKYVPLVISADTFVVVASELSAVVMAAK